MSESRDAWVFDADGHVVEPPELWTELLPERYRAYAPRVLEFDDHFRYVCNDRIGFRIYAKSQTVAAPGQTQQRTDAPVTARGGWDASARLADMDIDHIERAALYPTYGLMIQGVTEREPALALCRALNDWLADYCSGAPERLVGIGTLPMTHPEDALGEARRCIEELGFRGVWRRPERFESLPALHDRGFDPLWSYLEEADLPLAIHPGLNGVVPYGYFGERFDDDFTTMHAAHFPVEQLMNLTELIGFGVLERHPKLRVALLESGAVWALSYLHRLDEHQETFGFRTVQLSLRPSEYFRRQCYVSVEAMEPGLELMLASYPDSVLFASDYPHADGTFPGSTRELLETDRLDPSSLRRVLRDNAIRLYALDRA